MKFRFGIRTTLLFVAIIAIATPLVLHWQFEQRWSTPRKKILEWARKLNVEKRKTGFVHSVLGRDGSHIHFAIANSPIQIDGDHIRYTDSEEIELGGERFYIQPPGMWVPDIESAITIWDQH